GSRLNVQKVRLAGCLRALPRSWTLLLALAGFLRQAPRLDSAYQRGAPTERPGVVAPGALHAFCRGTEPRCMPAIISRAEAPSMSHDDRHEPDRHVHGGRAPSAAVTVIDPVCGMDVTPGEAEGGS